MNDKLIAFLLVATIVSTGLLVVYIDLRFLYQRYVKRFEERRSNLESHKSSLNVLDQRPVIIAAFILTFIGLICLVDGFFIEPYQLSITRHTLESSKLGKDQILRIAHITDLHFERPLDLHERILEEVGRFSPDLIVLTGDYVNERSASVLLAEFASSLTVIAPTYAVMGNWDPRLVNPKIFKRAGVGYIEDKKANVTLRGIPVTLIGLPMFGGFNLEDKVRGVDSERLNIVLTHTPDLIPEVGNSGVVDFYFCGHTHGGQVRIPFYGALFTLCETGKRFEMGLYRLGEMYAFTSRGVGMEGGAAPRVRFLCPPEIALFTLRGRES